MGRLCHTESKNEKNCHYKKLAQSAAEEESKNNGNRLTPNTTRCSRLV